MTLSIYRPLRLADAMNRLFEESFVRPYGFPSTEDGLPLPMDVMAKDDEYVITAAVPGLQPEHLTVEVLGDSVTVRGEVFAPAADDQASWLLQERRYGKFSRNLSFPVELDSAKAEATVEHGVLTLRIPKAEAARPKQVKVKIK